MIKVEFITPKKSFVNQISVKNTGASAITNMRGGGTTGTRTANGRGTSSSNPNSTKDLTDSKKRKLQTEKLQSQSSSVTSQRCSSVSVAKKFKEQQDHHSTQETNPTIDLEEVMSDASGVISNTDSESESEKIPALKNKSKNNTSSSQTGLPLGLGLSEHSRKLWQNLTKDFENETNTESEADTNNNYQNKPYARKDLNTLPNFQESANQVIISSTDSHFKLTNANPLKLQNDINSICGPVLKVDYQRSGNLIITTISREQVTQLSKATTLPSLKIPIKTAIAWGNQISYGKIMAPEFANDSLEEILEMLSEHNVVSVRKFFFDEKRKHIPLYVLTFVGAVPQKIKIGYVSFNVDTYFPSPLRCKNCHRLRHSAANCRSKETCSNCSSTEHSSANCTSQPRCINCKGSHPSLSKLCPELAKERLVCTIKTQQGIGYQEARELANSQINNRTSQVPGLEPSQINTQTSARYTPSGSTSPRLPNISSNAHFPQLASQMGADSRPDTYSFDQSDCSQIITPGQRQKDPDSYASAAAPHCTGLGLNSSSQLSLPPLSPLHSQSTFQSSTSNARPPFETLTSSENCTSTNENNLAHLLSLLPKILPIFIKIIFTQDLTVKIQSLTEIGQILNMDSLIASTLSSMQVSSNTSL